MTQSLLRLAADFSRQLAASVSIGATTATLNAYTDSDGVALQNNVLYGFTIDKGANKEYIVATHLNGALSGVMNITRQGVASSGFAKAHRIGAPVEITDWAILSRIVNLLNGTTDLDSGTPLKYDGAPSQAQANALATVQFVLDTASGSTVLAFNPLTIDGVAGENITDGDWIYFKESDGQWYKVDADSSASSVGVKIGKARGTALAEAGIPGGIFVYGVETEGTYTTGQAYYISNTAGQLSTTPGTNSVKVGVGDDNEDLVMTYVNPSELTPGTIDALAGGGDLGTPSSTNKFLTESAGVTKGKMSLNAGATINGATLPVPVYQNKTDNEVYACDGNDLAALKFLGFAISNSTDGNPITVQFNGIVSGFTGLSEGEKYYLQDAVGTIGTSVGTYEVLVGVAVSETQLLIQKGRRYASGTLDFSSTTTQTITVGFRPSVVRVHASTAVSTGPLGHSVGSWSVYGSNRCSYNTSDCASNAASGVRSDYAWYAYRDGTGLSDGNRGVVDTITDTSFRLNNSKEGGGSSTASLFWEAEGEL